MRCVALLMMLVHLASALEHTKEDRDRLIRLEIKLDEMGKRFDDKFGLADRRFGQVQAQIVQTNNIMTAIVAGMFAMIGFVWWDGRTLLA